MPPAPNREHQDLEWNLEFYLRMHWARSHHARVYHQINVAAPGGWPNNYRIPDLVLLTPERFGIDRNEYFEGAPDVVVEIHSPGDESYDKLGFYAELGVPEVWIIDRDTKSTQIHVLQQGRYCQEQPRDDGWIGSPAARVLMRSLPAGTMDIQREDDPSTQRELTHPRSAL